MVRVKSVVSKHLCVPVIGVSAFWKRFPTTVSASATRSLIVISLDFGKTPFMADSAEVDPAIIASSCASKAVEFETHIQSHAHTACSHAMSLMSIQCSS